MIGRRNEDIVDVKQETAAGTPGDLLQKLRLRNCALGELQIGRRVFEQHLTIQSILDLVDMLTNPSQSCFRVRQRQKIVEKNWTMARPGEVFGKTLRLVSVTERSQPLEMLLVER